jgi:hypothetical protein
MWDLFQKNERAMLLVYDVLYIVPETRYLRIFALQEENVVEQEP